MTAIDANIIKKFIPFIYMMRKYHKHTVKGITHIPKEGRALIAVNHSFATYDTLLLILSILEKRTRLVRSLADHNFFKIKQIAELMEKLGVKEGHPDQAMGMLEKEELLLVAPGGMFEALKTSQEKNQIMWDKRKGFIKISIKTQTPIILAACPDADDIYDIEKNKWTEKIYSNYKLPFIYPKGVFNSLIPKPVTLTHYIHKPIAPPLYNPESFDKDVDEFHQKILQEMMLFMDKHDLSKKPL